ncbi:hypothetical protein ACTL6U_04605 [Rhodovibrionaceae bacterium A322]
MSRIRYVAGVSWPRSGHHVLVRTLERYFGEKFAYCEFYSSKVDCCRTFPCSREGLNLSKNHDSDGKSVPTAGVPYLIQYRSLMASVISNYELYVRNGNTDDIETFEVFARESAEKWARFITKWTGPAFPYEACEVAYEDLVQDPFATLSRVIGFFAPDDEVDEDLLQTVISQTNGVITTKEGWYPLQNAGIRQFRNVESFRFYDGYLFAELEDLAESYKAEYAEKFAVPS